MRWFFNDLSLTGQYADAAIFCRYLEALVRLRERSAFVRERLFCSRRLHERPVTAGSDFREAVQRSGDKDFTRRVLGWVGQRGPFWEDEREAQDDDYFEFEGQDVTEQGLGEAARRRLSAGQAGTFSFVGGLFRFDRDELEVQHGLVEAPLGYVSVPNVYSIEHLEQAAVAAIPSPRNWNDVLNHCRERFGRLIIADTIEAVLRPEPFSAYVGERIFELLGVLEQFVLSRDAGGNYTEQTNEIMRKHFSGAKAWFSDESITNKRNFQNELTFKDPSEPEKEIFCPWHGKVKTPQFRIHFAWPLTPRDDKIKVVFIGPKITKD